MRARNRNTKGSRRLMAPLAAGLACSILACAAAAQEYRPFDGYGNNIQNPTWGAANTAMLRLLPAAYDDGVSAPTGGGLPGARLVSNIVHSETSPLLAKRKVSNNVMQWGQWITHDLGFKNTQEPAEPFNIPVPQGDPFFDPLGTGQQVLPFFRSKFDPSTGTGPGNPREQVSFISSYIDGNTVYGMDKDRSDMLRSFQDGKLRVFAAPEGDLLPWNDVLEPMDPSPFGSNLEELMLTGDNRANTTTLLLATHTLWMREHNRLADELKAANPRWSDEKLFQEARRRVIALNQIITFGEYLPAILGEGAIPAYTGYKPGVNATVSNEFSHSAFRFGHSQANQLIARLNEDGTTIEQGFIRMRDNFFRPELLHSDGGIDPLLRGMMFQPLQENDRQFTIDLRSFVLAKPDSLGFDMAALDIQRGRDHGLPLYNDAREGLGLTRLGSFSEVSEDPATVAALAEAYATIDDVDFFVGGICEDHIPGSQLGPLFHKIILDDFVRVRDGDRFWYANDGFSTSELAELEATTLRDVIRRNTEVVYAPVNVFFAWPDLDQNYRLDIEDFISFQLYFALGDMRADYDKNGVLNIDDFIEFQSAYAQF